MKITRLKFERFTAFDTLDFEPSDGINVIIGTNGTGKTHLMKVAYAACDASKEDVNFAGKLARVFLPSGGALGRLVKRQRGSSMCELEIHSTNRKLRAKFSNHTKRPDSAEVTGVRSWTTEPISSVFIPAKEMLANAPGFRSLYEQRETHFEEIYADIITRAYLPPLRGPTDHQRKDLLRLMRKTLDGKVETRSEEFFLRNRQGMLEFTLLAEGIRKLGYCGCSSRTAHFSVGRCYFGMSPRPT